jgi:hypothetical protein
MDTLFNYVTMQVRAINPNLLDHNYARYTGFGTKPNNHGTGLSLEPLTNQHTFDNQYSFFSDQNKPITIGHHGLVASSFVATDFARFPVNVDFSVEFKVHLTNSVVNTGLKTLCDCRTSNNGWTIKVNLSTGFIIVTFNSTDIFNISANFQILTNYHICFSRKNNIFKLFLNGQEIGINSSQLALTNNYTSGTTALTLGGSYLTRVSGEDCVGYFDDLRITKHIARYYDNNFTVPDDSEFEFGFQRNQFALQNGNKVIASDSKVNYKAPLSSYTENFRIKKNKPLISFDLDIPITPIQLFNNGIIETTTSRDNVPQSEQINLFNRETFSLLKRKKSDNQGKSVFRKLHLIPNYLLISNDKTSSLPRKNAAVRDFARCFETIKFDVNEIELEQGQTSQPISIKAYNFTQVITLTLSCTDPDVTIFPTTIKVSPTSYNHLFTITSTSTGVKEIIITPDIIFPTIDALIVNVF